MAEKAQRRHRQSQGCFPSQPLAAGLPGDVAPVGQGVSELRIHYGPGYRVYFYQQGEVLVLLLCGGDKGSQRRDIETAHQLLKEWREQHHG
ncbi:type II toxin-antitoxin system RelE/ParE family toxin [Oceanimonas smirnovii]|uniref:type II toxin-antitoxin system RelE/ParE family toxin n=1 Tax=Oceanimonas smirnovii TaxID=264574 RepID=UPI003AAD6FDA